ncbi:MAG: ABC transporter permease subunit [Saprospiraceae bacterium]|nr:ABC transporter permease subunit [Pyrinomonadaceae bacterium]
MAENVEIIKGTSLWGDAWKRLLKNKLAVFGLVVLALMVIAVTAGPYIIRWATGFTADYIPSNVDEGDLVRSFPPSTLHPMGTDDSGRDLLARVLQGGRISLMVGIISTFVSLIVGVSYGAIAGYMGGRIDNLMMRIVDIIYAIPYILIVIVLLSVFGGPNTLVLIGALPVMITIFISLIILAVILYTANKAVFGQLDEKVNIYLLTLLKLIFAVLSIALVVAAIWANLQLNEAVLAGFGDWLGEKYSANVNQGISQILLLFFALGLVSWLTMARVVRGQVLSLKNQEFVLAAKATGVSSFGIIFRHLVPNALGPVIVYATLTVPSVMLTEAFLSFLGLGVQAPYASWGSLASEGIKNISIFPWQMIFPGVTMALTLFSLNFLGDGLRDALDPQTRKF